MRILFVSHAADVTGAPISARQMAVAMAARGHELRIILRRDGPLAEGFRAVAPVFFWRREAGFSLADAGPVLLRYGPVMAAKCLRNPDRPYCMSRADQAEAEQLAATLRDWSPQAIYANTSHCGDIIDGLALAAPVFTHVREMAPTIHALDPRRRRSALEKTRLFLCASRRVADDLSIEFGVPHSRLRIEPPAIEISPGDYDAADLLRREIEARYGLAEEDRLVVGAGTVVARKGADLFYEAGKRALAEWRGPGSLVFLWLGDGEQRDGLVARASAEGLAASIRFPGMSVAPLPVLRRADAVLVTSREDPYPRVAIEAAAMGAAIAAFEGSGGAVELIADYQAGDIVPAFDAAAMGRAALRLVAAARPGRELSARVIAGHGVVASAARVINAIEDVLRYD